MFKNKKILIFTDSRGEHKVSFQKDKIFSEKLKDYFFQHDIECELMLCPFSWTSTLEFIYCIDQKVINKDNYDFIILYTGVVEYSPRPISNYNNALSKSKDPITYEKLLDRERKNGRITNSKKIIINKYFDEDIIQRNKEYSIKYDNEYIKSLMSLEMNENFTIPRLQELGEKLIFINSNRCVNGWEGNYILKNPKGRPENINVIEEYSRQTIGKFENYIDLLKWTDEEIKEYTVDNMHLTYEGSEHIFELITSLFEKKYFKVPINDKILFVMGNGPSIGEIMNNPEYLQILKNNHTFGLNAAYRAYEKYDFYPTYFGCFDYVVNESHKKSFENMVLENNPIKEFYFIGNSKDKQNLYKQEVIDNIRFQKFNFIHVAIDKYHGISESFDEYYNPGSSGANALQIGIMKGYKKIVLLGCDCNYVEEVDGVIHYGEKGKSTLELTKNLNNNPNYWFSDYQKKGDRFNLPGTSKFQMGSWENMSKFCPDDVEIINGSKISKIPYFPKNDFKNIKC